MTTWLSIKLCSSALAKGALVAVLLLLALLLVPAGMAALLRDWRQIAGRQPGNPLSAAQGAS